MDTPFSAPVSKLPNVGTTIFTLMSALAAEHGAINLSQGFPDYPCDPALLDAAQQFIAQGTAATHAWSQSIDTQCDMLQGTGSPLLAERANDLRDLKQRVLRALLGWLPRPVRALLGAGGYLDVQSWRDLAGIERVSGARQG